MNNSSYTRSYGYVYGTSNNRLVTTEIDGTVYTYGHDGRGNMTTMPHLDAGWGLQNQMTDANVGGVRTFYQYDSGGERVRKYTDKGSIREERIYLGSYEVYREYDGSGNLTLERTTVHVSDDTGRIAMLENRTVGTDPSPAVLTRYIYSNHLQSATLELDEVGRVISYEEYHPYGTTAFQAMNAAINAVAKRYRFSGKERDEESGLYYHGARYYAPWLGRWTAADPLEAEYAPLSPYNYCLNNPVSNLDPDGRYVVAAEEKKKDTTNQTPITYTTSAGGQLQGEIGEVAISGKKPSFWQRLGSGLGSFGEGLWEGARDAVVETVKFAVNVFRPDEQNSLWQTGKALYQIATDPLGTGRALADMVRNTDWSDPKTYGKLAGNLLVNIAGPGLVAKGVKAVGEAAQLSRAVKATEELVNLGRADEVVTAGAAGAAGVGQGASTSAGARFIVTEGGTTIIEDAAVLEKTLNNANFPKFTTQGQGIGYELPNGVQVRIMQPSGPNPLRASFNLPNGTKVTPEGLIPQPPRGLSPAMRKQWLNERTHINLK